MGWKACFGYLTFALSCLGQNIANHHKIKIFPFQGNVGEICFEELSGGNKICLKPPTSMAADVTATLPDASDSGKCIGWTSSTTLGNLACSGGSGITLLGGQSGSSQTFSDVDDTNVTLTISSSANNHQFAIGWAGTLAKARQNSATVYNDQTNTYTGGNQDFTSASLKVPSGAGLEPTTEGYLGYNTTNGKLNIGRGGGINNGLAQTPDVTITGNVPVWNDPLGREIANGYTPTSVASNNTLALRSAYGGGYWNDAGSQVVNVKAYGAVGDGSTDDRAAIQSAIDLQTYGGIVYFPPGDFYLNSTHPTHTGCGVVVGNGTTSSYSTQNAITLQGAGKGVGEDFSIGNSTRGATRLKSGTSSITKMICLEGPVVNVWINDIFLDGNANTANGILFNHVAESGINRVGFRKFTNGWGMDFTAKAKLTGGWAFYTCGNRLSNFTMGEASSTSFSGIRLSGVYDSDSGPYHTSCSNVFERFGVSYGTAAGAVGVELAYADNNKFINGGFSTYGGSGKPVNFTQQSDGASGANFPYGNKFINIDSNQSQIYYGTNGNRGNFVLSHTEAEGNADPNLARLYWMTDWGRTEVDASNAVKFYRARASTGTEIFSLARGGVTGAGVEINAYNEIQFLNPSFVEGHMKIKPETSANPGTCSSTNEGWLWVKAASSGVATTLTMCAANSSGTFDWRTVATF